MVRKIVQGSTLLYASPGPGLEKNFCPNSGGVNWPCILLLSHVVDLIYHKRVVCKFVRPGSDAARLINLAL